MKARAQACACCEKGRASERAPAAETPRISLESEPSTLPRIISHVMHGAVSLLSSSACQLSSMFARAIYSSALGSAPSPRFTNGRKRRARTWPQRSRVAVTVVVLLLARDERERERELATIRRHQPLGRGREGRYVTDTVVIRMGARIITSTIYFAAAAVDAARFRERANERISV